MARGQTRQTERVEVQDVRTAPPRMDEHTRYINARANRNGLAAAEALKDTFVLGRKLMDQKQEELNQDNVAQAVAEAADGIDRDEANKNAAYINAWETIEAEKDYNEMESGISEALVTAGASEMDEAEVQAFITQYFQQELGGIEDISDTTYARYLAPRLLELEGTLIANHRQQQIEKTVNQHHANINANAKTAWNRELSLAAQEGRDPVFDYETHFNLTGELMPGDRKKPAFWETLIDLAEETGHPELLTNVPETINGIATKPGSRQGQEAIEAGVVTATAQRAAIQKQADDAFKREQMNNLAAAHSYDKRLADAGDPAVLSHIKAGTERGPNGEPPRYSEAQATALYDRFFSAKAGATVDAAMTNDWFAGNGVQYTQNEVDTAVNNLVRDPGFLASMEGLTPEQQEKKIMEVVIERAVVNHPAPLPTILRKNLEVLPTNPEKFMGSIELYRQIEAQYPGQAKRMISDAAASRMARFERLTEDFGGDTQKAMEMLTSADSSLSAAAKSDIDDAAEGLAADLNDKPWSLSNYNDPNLERAMRKEIGHYVDMGYDIEQAKEAADRYFRARFTPVGGRYWSTDAGWGETPEKAYEYAIENEALSMGTDPENVDITPHPHDPKLAWVRNADSALPGYTIPVAQLSLVYKQAQEARFQETVEGSAADLQAEAEARAKQALVPDYIDLVSGMDLESKREAMWNALSANEQQSLINDQIK